MNTKAILKRFDFKILILQAVLLYLLVKAAGLLYVAVNGEAMLAILQKDDQLYESLTDVPLAYMIAFKSIWEFYGLVASLVLIALINWKWKLGYIHSIILTFIGIATFAFFPYPVNVITGAILSVSKLVTNNFIATCYLASILLTMIALALLAFVYRIGKKNGTAKAG